MSRIARIAVIGALLGAQIVPPLPGFAALPASSIGIDAAIRNVVQIKIITEAAMRRAILREPIHIGDVVASGPNSAMQVLLKDQSVFTVGANARMTIDRFVYDPDRGTGSLAASVARGAFRFMSGRAAHAAGQVAIRTPVASIGVRGTIVEVLVGDEAMAMLQTIPALATQTFCKDAEAPGSKALKGKLSCADPNSATLIVLRGPGPNRIGNDRVGAIDVTANGRTLAVNHVGVVAVGGPGQPPLGPFPLPPALAQYFDADLSTTPASQSQRDRTAQIEKSVRGALREPDYNASVMLARVVLDSRSTPDALQAALANAAASFHPGSRTFDMLMRMSYVVMRSTNSPSIDILGHELATDQGAPIVTAYRDTQPVDLPEAVSSVVVQRLASTDMPPRWDGRPRPGGDTLLAADVFPLVREAPQASPF